MNAKLVSKENYTARLTFEVGAERFEEGMKHSYNKNKNYIAMPGFRKGKAPRKLIEKQYGADIFYDDAINFVLPEAYEEAVKELELEVVDQPTIDIESVSVEEGVKFIAVVTVEPEVTLGEYKGLEYTRVDVEVTEADLEAELKMVQEKNARTVTVERPAENGDIVNISYHGTVDGVAFEGGHSDSYELTLGSHSFIDTFEDQIVGHNTGDKFDVNVTFPSEYHAPDLAGKAAVFAVELKEITVKELPEINDEFAQDVSEFDTLDEYKADIMAKIKTSKEAAAKNQQNDELIDRVAIGATIDVPEVMIENKVKQMLDEVKQSLVQQGLPAEAFEQYMGGNSEQFKSMYRMQAENMVKAKLALKQIAVVENLEVTDEEINEAIKQIGEAYGIDVESMVNMATPEERKSIKGELLVQKAIDFVANNAVEVEPVEANIDDIKVEKVEE